MPESTPRPPSGPSAPLPSGPSRRPAGVRPRRGRGLVAIAALTAMLCTVELAPSPAGADVPETTTTTTTVPTEAPPMVDPAPAAAPDPFAGLDQERLRAFFRALAGPPVPARSGQGRRIVYSNRMQRVWLVEADGRVARTYLVSGRRGLPKLGTYRVFAKARHTTSGSVRMEYMVRFAHGRRLAIGFHTIPVRRNGTPLQSAAQLGTPQSHGCVRQHPADAIALWGWTQVGTTVVAVA